LACFDASLSIHSCYVIATNDESEFFFFVVAQTVPLCSLLFRLSDVRSFYLPFSNSFRGIEQLLCVSIKDLQSDDLITSLTMLSKLLAVRVRPMAFNVILSITAISYDLFGPLLVHQVLLPDV
jgi:hypothetical protein